MAQSRSKRQTRAKVRVVMSEYAAGELRSWKKDGPKVTDRKRAVAIGLSEGRKR